MVNNKPYDKYSRNKDRDRFYHSTAWKRARELALLRDSYLCQECLKHKRITNADMVHHIVEVKDDIKLALTLNNLISLCNQCHNKQHGQQGYTSNKLKVVTIQANPEII
ncbi:HNH endonuclease [Solibacillus sp. FSL H8-0538]|uniref:HNH endonuclease n=1 Tax=Solibacillus sp. FSL H8-0538 TaxID=2921400 RepID=UPI0030FA5CEA